MKNKIFALFTLLVTSCSPAYANDWEDLNLLNTQIDQTNFSISDDKCSATLIDIEDRLLLTAAHCVDQYVTKTTRTFPNLDGTEEVMDFYEYADVPASQYGFSNYERVAEYKYTTKIIAYGPQTDLAVLQIKAEFIPNVMKSDLVQQPNLLRGSTIYIVGNPLGEYSSLTKGIISAKDRKVNIGEVDLKYFQFSGGAAPGNSGGAVYNEHGQIIGVMSSVRAMRMGITQQLMSHMGFAIPSDVVLEWMEEEGIG